MKLVKVLLSTGLLISLLTLEINTVYAQSKVDQEINIIRKVAEYIMSNSSYDFIIPTDGKVLGAVNSANYDKSVLIRSPFLSWNYWNGVTNIAMLKLSDNLNDQKYRDYAVKNYEFAFDNLPVFKDKYQNQDKWKYPFGQLIVTEQLDDCGAMGAGLLDVYRIAPRKEYKDYLQSVADFILQKQSRLADKTLVRPEPVKMTLWADDLYMSIVFLSRMGNWTKDKKYFDDAILQVENFNRYLYNPATELYYHCWYSDLETNGVAHWSRCNGWIMMAQVELLDKLPSDYPGREKVIKNLQQQIKGISHYQDVSGMWHQILDKNDSYLEASGTAMFTYSIAKAVNNGWIDKRYISIALEGWKGVKKNILDDGQIRNVCAGTAIENNMAFYYNRPTPPNDIHGFGPFLLAGNEIIKYLKNN